MLKSKLRKKILKARKKFNIKNIQINFNQIIKILKKENISKKIIGGYYDRLIKRLSKKKNIIKIGLAFSIQEIDKVPINVYDQKLDYIVTNKYIVK